MRSLHKMGSKKTEITPEQLERAMDDYKQALEFTNSTHLKDLNRIDSLDGLMTDFDKFFYEYVYVVLASGFRAIVAARLAPQIVECQGDMEKMQSVFKNQRKLDAIENMWNQRKNWDELRASLKTVDDCQELPFIGPTTKYHLARNIGLISMAKPDLHMIRWVEEITGRGDEETVHQITQEIAKKVNKKQGTVDFALWVWFSHNRGEENKCCHGGFELR